MKAAIDGESFPHNGNDEVRTDGDANLRSHGVVRVSPECLNLEMSFDPFEEQLDLPAVLVQVSNRFGVSVEVVREKHIHVARLRVKVFDPSQLVRVLLHCLVSFEPDGLVAAHTCRLVRLVRVQSGECRIVLGPGDEECASFVNLVQPFIIQIAAIHDIVGARFVLDQVKKVHVMHVSLGNVEENGDAALHVQHGMHLHRGLGRHERGPLEYRQTQFNRGGINEVDRTVEIEVEGDIVGVESTRLLNQHLRKIAPDAPVAVLVRIRERGADDLSTESQMVPLVALRTKTDDDVPQTFSVGELSERESKKLVPTGELLRPIRAFVSSDTLIELITNHMIHDLRKDVFSLMHRDLSEG